MVNNLKETGTPFAYKKVDFGKKVRKIVTPHYKNDADDGLDEADKMVPGINAGIDGFPDSRNRFIEKTFEDSD